MNALPNILGAYNSSALAVPILEEVCRQHHITLDQLRADDRRTNIVVVRFFAFYLLREVGKLSHSAIAAATNKDRGSVTHGLAAFTKQMSHNPELSRAVEQWIQFFSDHDKTS